MIEYSSGSAITSPLRLQLIVCTVLQREARYCVARSGNCVDVVLMEQGLHNEPERLRREVQKVLERPRDTQGRPYDASLLGYGLCSNGTVGLGAEIPIVIPRAHDCITLLLGSRERYQEYFDSHRGAYWYSPGWIESGRQPGPERYESLRAEYTAKYGPENAEYLMQVEQTWIKEYHWAVYVDWGLAGSDAGRSYTRRCAQFLGWDYDELKGDSGLMQRFVDGCWSEQEFLIVPPGRRIAEDVTADGIIKAQ
jgi:hypothetical protein